MVKVNVIKKEARSSKFKKNLVRLQEKRQVDALKKIESRHI